MLLPLPARLLSHAAITLIAALLAVSGSGCSQPPIEAIGQLPTEPLLYPADGAGDVPPDTWIVIEGELVGTTLGWEPAQTSGSSSRVPMAVQGPPLMLRYPSDQPEAVDRAHVVSERRVLVVLLPEEPLAPGSWTVDMEGEPVTTFTVTDQGSAAPPAVPVFGDPGDLWHDTASEGLSPRYYVEVPLEHDGLFGLVRGREWLSSVPEEPDLFDESVVGVAVPPPGETILVVREEDSGPPEPGAEWRTWIGYAAAFGVNGAFSGWSEPVEVELPPVTPERR